MQLNRGGVVQEAAAAKARPLVKVQQSAKVLTGFLAAVVGFVAPGVSLKSDVAQREEAGGASAFRIPPLVNSARATMHWATIENLPTVLRFKATIMDKRPGEIDAFVHKLFHEAVAAKNSGDSKAILRSTKRLMVLTEALRDRIAATEKARK
jgi:hypothetical protein